MATHQAVTEREILAHLVKHPVDDQFLDQTLHMCQHGMALTDLGRLILTERIRAREERADTRLAA